MSQAKNHLKWRIKKTKEEVKKGDKHRGILEIKPDIELSKEYIQKAEHNLKVFLYNKEGGY